MTAVVDVLGWLDAVKDPEIPVLSIIDLGIVRAVRQDEGQVTVVITPTYTGCPAMGVIAQDISDTLRAHGVNEARIEIALAPAWTTDWMTERGREALRAYGIAPPVAGTCGALPASVACPRCGSARTGLISRFGSTACKALYRCDDCREPFDHFKCH
ncbi:1,2-phenylacetyl-CoA epoxidase subunit PaaD [Zavarzinia aquatilis]|uniref:Phenylacetate-CoA oxygenase subunit PaaJ n=1 Tax=Zavarzinia aquatilis TaxID=2211142 RepID=A0A317DXI7_9PROT|nr:1,2-phenylacetyl-CoA epoxidase subunit PaaD [Zavarzinia aquatilis]PWR17545.1 phenylacetate-CoA oxygenase subunit PaaJ [Zavarzinia aquatilis]